MIGATIGSYLVLSKLGEGGMGEVYRARDLKLQRDVALKVLPSAVAADHDRLARFTREAQLLAALNHPNIAQIHGSVDDAGVTALILEFVEGEDLSSRIARGPLPVKEALTIARQIAAALAAAHDAGIVHRDLKPANVKLRTDGTVKVLDFGIAKTVEAPAGASGPADSSPTMSAHATGMGVVLGTAAYMSPEQARGKIVDRRTDIFSFGCVLFEMLSGVRAFRADEAMDAIVAVLTKEPEWSLLPATTPHPVRRLLRHLLEKDPRRRLDSATAASLAIEDALTTDSSTDASAIAAVPRTGSHPLPWAIAGLVAGALIAVAAMLFMNSSQRSDAVEGVTRSVIGIGPAEYLRSLPIDDTFGEGRPSGGFALSPDGRVLAFSAVANGRQQLFVRRLDGLEADAVTGTDEAHSPFFSPDSQWIGFFARGALHKVALSGAAPPTEICRIPTIFGASWSADGSIVYALEAGGLWRVSSSGGVPQPLTTAQHEHNEYSHRLPHVLPAGNAVVFTVIDTFLPRWDEARLEVVDLRTGQRRTLGIGADARYINSGHLVFIRAGTLVVAPFDQASASIVGDQIAVLSGVAQAANTPNADVDTGVGQFSVSQAGALVYARGDIFPDREASVLAIDRRGRVQAVPLPPPRAYLAPRRSPDGKRLVLWSQGLERTIWTYDLERATLTRITREARNHRPIWTPDGSRVVYARSINGTYNLFAAPADGSGTAERLTNGPGRHAPSTWASGGGTLIFLETKDERIYDIVTLTLEKSRESKILLHREKVSFTYPEISADGKWIAYVSNESGREEVYVQPYPDLVGRTQVSSSGGRAPAWSRNGRELFYTMPLPGGRLAMMSASIVTTPALSAGVPQQLFEGPYFTQQLTRGYDVTSDGQQFLMTEVKERPPVRTRELVLVQNWAQELTRQVPSRR